MKKNDNDNVIGCLAFFLLVIFLMPIVGIVMIGSDNPDKKSIGVVLFIIGIVMWIMFFTMGK